MVKPYLCSSITVSILCGMLLASCATVENLREKIEDGTFLSDPAPPPGKEIDKVPLSYNPAKLVVDMEKDLKLIQTIVSNGLISLPKMTKYLDKLLDNLKAHLPTNGNISTATCIATSPTVGAFATADGHIVLTYGLLQKIESEDEVVAVLAHELAHVVFNHHDSEIFVNFQRHALTATTTYSHVKTLWEIHQSTFYPNKWSRRREQIGNMERMLDISELILFPSWTRKQERQADRLAIDLLIKAGYNSNALSTALDKLPEWAPSDQTIEQVNKLTQSLRTEIGSKFNVPGLPIDLKQMGDFLQELIKAGTTIATKEHPSTTNRIKQMRTYTQNEYGRLTPPQLQEKPWNQIQREVKNVFDNYKNAFDALDSVKERNFSQAKSLAKKATQYPTNDHAFPWVALATVLEAQGKLDDAIERLEVKAFVRKKEKAVLQAYIQAADIRVKKEEYKKAVETLEKAYQKFNKPVVLLPKLITVYKKTKLPMKAKAHIYYIKCTKLQSSYPEIVSECKKVAP